MRPAPALLALLVTATMLAPYSARAQTGSPEIFLPPEVREEQERLEGLEPPVTPEPPRPAPPVAVGTGPAFRLNRVVLDGNTALTTAALAPLWADLAGRDVTLTALEDLAERIGAQYRAEGYVLSQAFLPEQVVEGGVVRIQVVEGFVDRIALEGGSASARSAAERFVAPVAVERPLKLSTLERGVLLSRDTLGGTVETVLAPSPDTFAAADLTVLIEPKRYDGFAAIDNRGSRLYGDGVTATAGGSAYDLWGLNERWDLLVAAAPDDLSLRYGEGAVELPLPALSGTWLDGARLRLSGDASRADPDLAKAGSPEDLTVILDETNVRAALIVPFIRTRPQNLYGRLGLDWQDSTSENDLGGVVSDTQTDRLLVLSARGTWDRADRFGGVTLLDLELRQGLDVAGATDLDASGDPEFTLVTGSVARLQRLGDGGWSVYGELIGQAARTMVPNSERFALGSSTIGRGFAPGNTTGDEGYAARLELRRDIDGGAFDGAIAAVELYAFGDAGAAYDKDGDRDGDAWESLASAGFGARIDVQPWLTITPEIVRQLDGTPTDTASGDLETRALIGIIARF
jgi:hemolysin activation/secretion protein